MLSVALIVMLAQGAPGDCYGGLGAPEAPLYRGLLQRDLPLWRQPEGLTVDSDESRLAERRRAFEAARRFILDLKRDRAPLEQLLSTKKAALLRLDAYLARFAPGSQLASLGGDLKDRVARECSEIAALQGELLMVDVVKLEAAHAGEGYEEPLTGVVSESLLATLRRLEAGSAISPSLGWFGQEILGSTPPLSPQALEFEQARCADAGSAVDEFLGNDQAWRRVAEGLTLEQLVSFSTLVPRVDVDVQDRWCGSSATPSVTLDASGLQEIAIRKYDGCIDKVVRGWLRLSRNTGDPMTAWTRSEQWLPLVNPVRAKIGAPPLAHQTTW